SALNDGFLKARNVDKMKFYLMWANHDAKTAWDIRRSHKLEVIWPGSVDLPTFKTVVARVINKYFSHRCYYKIDGKPVFSIYDMNNLIKGLGGVKQTVAALDYFRSEVERAGFPGLHLQMIYWGKVPKIDDSGFASEKGTTANTIKTFKIDSLTNYQFAHLARPVGDYIPWADKAISNWPKWSKEFDAPYFPHISIGWDNNARFVEIRGAITENANPETFKKYLLKAKVYADAHPDQPKLITINAWNEWVEGSYLEPDERFGMGYLEAVRNVFVSPEVRKPSKKIKVSILSGQSNMVGHGNSLELPDALRKGTDRVLMFEDGKWQPLRPFKPPNKTQRKNGLTEFSFGPEIAFAHAIAEAWPDETIGIVKQAFGGTGVLAWNPNWTKEQADRTKDGGKGNLFKKLTDKVKAACASRDCELMGFVWQQGGKDMVFVDVAKEYLTNLKAMVDGVRKEVGAEDMPFLYGSARRSEWNLPDDLSDMVPTELNSGRIGAMWVFKAQWDAQQAITNAKMVIHRDLERHPKDAHYNTAGQLELGRLFAEAYLDMAEKF
ncbi:MAG: glycoside hydrolase family 99-like domain-containing protein, partial [Planctomycetota bacterium]